MAEPTIPLSPRSVNSRCLIHRHRTGKALQALQPGFRCQGGLVSAMAETPHSSLQRRLSRAAVPLYPTCPPNPLQAISGVRSTSKKSVGIRGARLPEDLTATAGRLRRTEIQMISPRARKTRGLGLGNRHVHNQKQGPLRGAGAQTVPRLVRAWGRRV